MPNTHKKSHSNNWLKEQAGHLTGHLIHDLLKDVLIAGIGTAALTYVPFKQHIHAIGLIIFTFIVMFVLLLANRIIQSRRRNISLLADNSEIVQEIRKLLKQ